MKRILIIAFLSILAITTNAQGCGCDELNTSQHSGTVGFSLQKMDIVNWVPDGSTTTTYEMCVVSVDYDYTYTRYECVKNGVSSIYTILNSFEAVSGSGSKKCFGVAQTISDIDAISQLEGSGAYGNSLIEYFVQTLTLAGCPPLPTLSVGAGCYALADVVWPPNAFCDSAIIGEGPTGIKRGRVYPPNTMYLPCEDLGCCTVETNGSRDPSSANCGNIDNSKIKWDAPCGTFFGSLAGIIEPCAPKCGSVNVNKMAAAKPNSKRIDFIEKLDETKAVTAMPYTISLINNGNTISISSIKDVKQINILDLNGKKSIEFKNLTSREIDFRLMSSGIYLVQVVKTDNSTLPAIKIQK